MRTLYWHCTPGNTMSLGEVESALFDVCNWLEKQFGTDILIDRVRADRIARVEQVWSTGNLFDPQEERPMGPLCLRDLMGSQVSDSDSILVSCCRDEVGWEAYRKEEYGAASFDARVAGVWHPTKEVVWHEAMHLLGADDCYVDDDDGNVICRDCPRDRNCLMQYDPDQVGPEIVLCASNICKVRAYLDQAGE